MGLFKRIVILCALFVSTGIVAGIIGPEATMNYGGTVIAREFTVQGWTNEDIANDLDILNELQTDITVFKIYRKEGAEPVTLYIGYYDSLQKSKLSHAPQVCFTGQGWIIESDTKVSVEAVPENFKVNRLILKRGEEKLLAYFWYQTQNHKYADLFRMKLTLLKEYASREAVGMKTDNAFVRMSIPLNEDSDYSDRILQQYIKDVLPVIDRELFLEKI